MDFARKQLEKYGWSDGKGLGKNENGISEALKPKLKRSVTGIGHDPASEFNEHWWTTLYNKAAGNVEVKESNGITKKIRIKDDFTISTNTWQIKRNPKKEKKEQYSEYFVKTSVISDGNTTENLRDSESDVKIESKDVFKMTDEELFAACEGRTAHKGARHGLRAIGKLARIAEQERQLLSQSRYNGYSHAKNIKEKIENVVDDATFNTEEVLERNKKKKKKRKRCLSNDVKNELGQEENILEPKELEQLEKVESVSKAMNTKKSKGNNLNNEIKNCTKEEFKNILPETLESELENIGNSANISQDIGGKKQSKVDADDNMYEENTKKVKKNKKRKKNMDKEVVIEIEDAIDECVKKKKKRKS